MFNVANKIDDLRRARGWTIYRLSMETGLTQQAIHAWYNADKPTAPSIATLEVVCEAFGITIAEFFTEKHTTEVPPKLKQIYYNLQYLSDEERDAVEVIVKNLKKK